MSKPLSSAAALSLTGATILAAYYWQAIWHFVLAATAARMGWIVLRAKLGIRPARRAGNSLWEVAAASLGGYIVGRRGKDTVAQAISSGAEIQIRVPAKPSRYRT